STDDTSVAWASRISSWHPTEVADPTGPGTAITTLPSAPAVAAVLRAPLRRPASTTTVPAVSAARSRFRTRNRCRAGGVVGGYSLITAPCSAIRFTRPTWPAG